MPPKQRFALILSVVISIVLATAALFLINNYLNEQKETIQEEASKKLEQIQANQTAVLVAKQNIPRGTTLDSNMLQTAIVPKQYVQPNAVTSVDRIAGMVVSLDIAAGEQITLSKLASAQTALGTGSSLAEVTPVGKRAITISVDDVSSFAGMIKPGDYVDVIANIPIPAQNAQGKQITQETIIPVLQNVLVLAVGQEIGTLKEKSQARQGSSQGGASPLITLALGPGEASLLTFLQEQSKIRLVLRSPADSKTESVQPMSWDALFQYLMPRIGGSFGQEASAVQASHKEEPKNYIEIYRGLERGKIPLSEEKQ